MISAKLYAKSFHVLFLATGKLVIGKLIIKQFQVFRAKNSFKLLKSQVLHRLARVCQFVERINSDL